MWHLFLTMVACRLILLVCGWLEGYERASVSLIDRYGWNGLGFTGIHGVMMQLDNIRTVGLVCNRPGY